MLSLSQSSVSRNSPKALPFALSALITFAPLFYLATHSLKLDTQRSNPAVVEIRLFDDSIKKVASPQPAEKQLATRLAAPPIAVNEPRQIEINHNSINEGTLPSAPQTPALPEKLNLNVGPKSQDSTRKSPVKQLIEEESAKSSKKQSEKFAADIQNAAKPDCLKNDHGFGLLNLVPLIYDIAKDKCN
jgi:hypothetical protein